MMRMILSAKRILTTTFLFKNILMPSQHLYEPFPELPGRRSMEARSGRNHDNKIAPQVSFNPTAANIMDMLCIFVITKQHFFQRVSNYF